MVKHVKFAIVTMFEVYNSVALSTPTALRDHHHYFQGLFITPKRKSATFKQWLPSPLLSAAVVAV